MSFDKALGIAINQACQTSSQFAEVSFHLVTRCLLGLLQTSLILGTQPLWVCQQITDFFPDRLLKQVGSHLGIRADALTAKAISVRADTAIVGIVPRVAFGGLDADRFAVIGVLTLSTHDQPLQQVACPALALARSLPVFGQLLLDRRKQLLTHQGWNGNADPLLFFHVGDA